jgi:hypothetical protein
LEWVLWPAQPRGASALFLPGDAADSIGRRAEASGLVFDAIEMNH